jgi:hypothetical protein
MANKKPSAEELVGVNLSNTDMRGANFWMVNFSHADMRGANLAGAYLRDTNLYRANLKGANLRKSLLRAIVVLPLHCNHFMLVAVKSGEYASQFQRCVGATLTR